MKIFLIAIGGKVMSELALYLKLQGHTVLGSDDEIFEPTRSRLIESQLMPEKLGWDPKRIDTSIEAIILGKHAFKDNPELLRAKELNIPVYSFPEYIQGLITNKKRIVVSGTCGKTTTTALIINALEQHGLDPDYLIGGEWKCKSKSGLKLSNSSIIVLEGDEYVSSALDDTPKMYYYNPDILIVNNIYWDHINVFSDFTSYRKIFIEYFSMLSKDTIVIYNQEDATVNEIVDKSFNFIRVPFTTPEYHVCGNRYIVAHNGNEFFTNLLGRHNMQNIAAAASACQAIGIDINKFYKYTENFTGIRNRMELVAHSEEASLYVDFAHNYAKVRETLKAFKETFPDAPLIACLELYNYSCSSFEYIPLLREGLVFADYVIIYISPHNKRASELLMLSADQLMDIINIHENIHFSSTKEGLIAFVNQLPYRKKTIVMMSSGNFDHISFNKIMV